MAASKLLSYNLRMATQKKGGFEPKDNTGSLFYDGPGIPTLGGQLKRGKVIKLTAEPEVDRNQKHYTRVVGDNVSGALYENDRRTNEKHPHFTGPIEINGEKLRMAAWKKEIKNGDNAGQEFLSLSISEPRS